MSSSPSPPRRLTGDGTLARADDGWIDFLSHLGQGPPEGESPRDGCFVARNFLLDEGILPARARSYEEAGGVAGHASYAEWQAVHREYLEDRVFLACDHGPPAILDPDDDPDEVPETFRHVDPRSPFLGTAPNAGLVRIEQVDAVAAVTGQDPARVSDLAAEVLAHRTPELEQRLNQVLTDWFGKLKQNPVFAAFWADVADLFSRDSPDWADTLRDRLGLAHLDPPSRAQTEIDILVFCYEVRSVPRIKGRGGHQRPLLVPTVLDGLFSEAFCPSPRGSTTGHVVNLDPKAGILRREVLHPRFAFQASHLWRVGTVKRGVERTRLADARAIHILGVRDETGRDDYASGTDGDIL